jgi:deoxycytidylate deaminase
MKYPYLPGARTILYVAAEHPSMRVAREHALTYSLDDAVKTGSVVVIEGVIVGRGANGSDYHKSNICERVRQKIPTGQGYELCEGCHPKNHSEPRAIISAQQNGYDTQGADLYLWGHWWCCEPCWRAIIDAGIRDVYLMEGSDRLFNREHPENILGKW